MYTQQSAKQLLLSDYQAGSNCSEKIEERLKYYRETAVSCFMKGIIEGDHRSQRTVYLLINVWFKNIHE